MNWLAYRDSKARCWWRIRKDGTRFWALVVIDAVRNEAGEVLGFAKVTRDLTERQFAQKHPILPDLHGGPESRQ